MLKKALRECCADLRSECRENIAAREWWRRLIGAKTTASQVTSGLFALPDVSAINLAASFNILIPFTWGRDEPTATDFSEVTRPLSTASPNCEFVGAA